MGTGRREPDNVAIRAGAAVDLGAKFQQHAGRIFIGAADVERLVRLQVGNVGQLVGGVFDKSQARGSLGLGLHRQCNGRGHPGSSKCPAP